MRTATGSRSCASTTSSCMHSLNPSARARSLGARVATQCRWCPTGWRKEVLDHLHELLHVCLVRGIGGGQPVRPADVEAKRVRRTHACDAEREDLHAFAGCCTGFVQYLRARSRPGCEEQQNQTARFDGPDNGPAPFLALLDVTRGHPAADA